MVSGYAKRHLSSQHTTDKIRVSVVINVKAGYVCMPIETGQVKSFEGPHTRVEVGDSRTVGIREDEVDVDVCHGELVTLTLRADGAEQQLVQVEKSLVPVIAIDSRLKPSRSFSDLVQSHEIDVAIVIIVDPHATDDAISVETSRRDSLEPGLPRTVEQTGNTTFTDHADILTPVVVVIRGECMGGPPKSSAPACSRSCPMSLTLLIMAFFRSVLCLSTVDFPHCDQHP